MACSKGTGEREGQGIKVGDTFQNRSRVRKRAGWLCLPSRLALGLSH